MAYRELEVSLLSAQELKSVNLIARMVVYAVVSISGDPLTRQCTAPDVYGGRNPCWNATFRFAVPPTSAAAAGKSLHVLLRAERFLGDRDVGEVVVPLSNVLAGAKGAGPQPPQVASYQVRKLHRWEPRGVLNVSYRLGPVVAPVSHPHPSEPPPGRYAGRVAEHDEAAHKSPVMGVPAKPPWPPSPRPPAPAPGRHAGRVAEHEEAPPPAPVRTPVYVDQETKIIFSGAPTTTAAGPPLHQQGRRPPLYP